MPRLRLVWTNFFRRLETSPSMIAVVKTTVTWDWRIDGESLRSAVKRGSSQRHFSSFPLLMPFTQPLSALPILPGLVFIHGEGDDALVDLATEVLEGRLGAEFGTGIVGLEHALISAEKDRLSRRDRSHLLVINLRCLDSAQHERIPDELYDYEYLFSKKTFVQRDFVRFLSFVTGQTHSSNAIRQKARSSFICLTFPDVNVALPNLAIVSMGADALELRVDLLSDSKKAPSSSAIPSLDYVAEQLTALRRRTELPIIFTTRSQTYGGRWPDKEHEKTHRYLRKALQWGVEYIDVEVGLSTNVKLDLVACKGHSSIICSYHNLTGTLKWLSRDLQNVYEECQEYGDIVMLAGLAQTSTDNYELESFRLTTIREKKPHHLIAFNTSGPGQISRIFNTFLNPVKHHMLPYAAAPSQLSVSDINCALTSMGQMPTKRFYSFGEGSLISPGSFFEKCFNEIGLPHQYSQGVCELEDLFNSLVGQPDFGGAVLHQPITARHPALISLTDTAIATGMVDILSTHSGILVGDNAKTQGIHSSLIRDLSPSAYVDQPVLVVSGSVIDAIPIVHALRNLHCGTIYTSGFEMPESMAENIEHCTSLKTFQGRAPFGVISTLPSTHSSLLIALLQLVGGQDMGRKAKIFVDFVNSRGSKSPVDYAASTGWTTIDSEDIAAWNTVEILRILVGQSVPYDFVRMASKRGIF